MIKNGNIINHLKANLNFSLYRLIIIRKILELILANSLLFLDRVDCQWRRPELEKALSDFPKQINSPNSLLINELGLFHDFTEFYLNGTGDYGCPFYVAVSKDFVCQMCANLKSQSNCIQYINDLLIGLVLVFIN